MLVLCYRAAQKREHHRGWRARAEVDEHGTGAENPCGEGPSGEDHSQEANVHLNGEGDPWAAPAGVHDVAGGTPVEEPFEESGEVLTQATEFTADEGGDTELRVDSAPRNRKCCAAATRGVNHLVQLLEAGFTPEEKRLVLHRYFADERIRAIDPELSTAVLRLHNVAATTVRSLRGALQTIRSTSIEGKTKVRNIVLTAAVSNGDSQRLICKALGASRYLVRKAFQRRAEVDESGENLWAGGDRKRRSDALSAEDHTSVCSWWETETTVSPNKRDVKRRRIGVKEHDTHATHYLHVSQVHCPLAWLYMFIVGPVRCSW